MKLKKGELKVYYKVEGVINSELDKALAAVLEDHGYAFWAGGLDLTTGIRDQCYDKVIELKDPIPGFAETPVIDHSKTASEVIGEMNKKGEPPRDLEQERLEDEMRDLMEKKTSLFSEEIPSEGEPPPVKLTRQAKPDTIVGTFGDPMGFID